MFFPYAWPPCSFRENQPFAAELIFNGHLMEKLPQMRPPDS